MRRSWSTATAGPNEAWVVRRTAPTGRLFTHTWKWRDSAPSGPCWSGSVGRRVVVIRSVLPGPPTPGQPDIPGLSGIEVVPGPLVEDPHRLGGHRAGGAGQFALVDPVHGLDVPQRGRQEDLVGPLQHVQ